MREPDSGIPGLLLHTPPGGGRVAFLPADLDRQFGRFQMPDHGRLLSNLVRWAANDSIPLKVDGAGLLDCHIFRQDGRFIVHIVNLSNEGAWRTPFQEILPVGPLNISVKLPAEMRPVQVRLLVSEQTVPFVAEAGWCRFTMAQIHDHEVMVLS
jgi:hypothetical protein